MTQFKKSSIELKITWFLVFLSSSVVACMSIVGEVLTTIAI